MLKYDILTFDYNTKTITFFFDNDQNKKTDINVFNVFEEYVIATTLDYYINVNKGDLVRIPGGSSYGSKKIHTLGWIRHGEDFFRPAFQSEVDYDDLNKYNYDNGKMYTHLEKIYNSIN
tara:strand:- start:349 stop:705 length:357 start_codon:yes stop_codon:yes gene_type:complete